MEDGKILINSKQTVSQKSTNIESRQWDFEINEVSNTQFMTFTTLTISELKNFIFPKKKATNNDFLGIKLIKTSVILLDIP